MRSADKGILGEEEEDSVFMPSQYCLLLKIKVITHKPWDVDSIFISLPLAKRHCFFWGCSSVKKYRGCFVMVGNQARHSNPWNSCWAYFVFLLSLMITVFLLL